LVVRRTISQSAPDFNLGLQELYGAIFHIWAFEPFQW
jgi:hypothetical protein